MPTGWAHARARHHGVLLDLLNGRIRLVKLRLVGATDAVRIPLMKEVDAGSDAAAARILRMDGCLGPPPAFFASGGAYIVEILGLVGFFLAAGRAFPVLKLLLEDFVVNRGWDQRPVDWGQPSQSIFIRKAGWGSTHFGHQRL
jgi:hypothetical protein